MGGQSHAPAALSQRQETRYPLYSRLGGHQGRSGCVQISLARTETRSPNCPARSESRCLPSLCTIKKNLMYVCMYLCIYVCMYVCMCVYIYTGCPRRKGPNFGRVFLRSNYSDITQNTYIQSSMVTEILAREF